MNLACVGLVAALAAGVASGGAVLAQAAPDPLAVQAGIIAEAQAELKPIVQSSLSGAASEATLKRRLAELPPLRARLTGVAAALTPHLADIDARLSQLGPPPAPGQPPEAATTAGTRAALTGLRQSTDSEIKQARLLAVEADQANRSLSGRLRRAFAARLWSRDHSIFDPELWRSAARTLPDDLARGKDPWREAARRSAAAMSAPAAQLAVGLAALAAVLLLWPARALLDRLVLRPTLRRPPGDPLSRSGLALWRVVAGVLMPLLAVLALRAGFSAAGALSPFALSLIDVAVRALVLGTLVAGLGAALLAPRRSAWRLAPISDRMARRLAPFPAAIGAAAALAAFTTLAAAVLGLSPAVAVPGEALTTLIEVIALGAALASLSLARGEQMAAAAETGQGATAATRGLWALAPALAWAAVVGAALALAFGYLALARFLAHQVVWTATLLAALLLLARFFDDLFPAVLAQEAPLGRALRLATGAPPSALAQFAVLLSGAIRLALVLFGASTLLAPFGASADDVISRFSAVNLSLRLGEVTLSPGAIVSAVVLFAVGLMATRAMRRWFETRYLPTTRMDVGVRVSLASAVTYLGVTIVLVLTLAYLGLSLGQIALFASALSVGIGFGLQAIVGNFVSGLVLLIERPVRVGDWIAIGDLEGDVKRINIRATEIEMMDRSRLIVPNSDLVTKTVRNVTADSQVARLRIVLRTDIAADPQAVRDLILERVCGHAEVLAHPSPTVFLSEVRDGALEFTCFAYVPSARLAYRIRSELLFKIVPAMRAKGIALASSTPVVNIGLPDRLIEPEAVADPPSK